MSSDDKCGGSIDRDSGASQGLEHVPESERP